MASPRYFVGIDLGTTYSTLCYVDEAGHVEAMRLPDGTYTLASAVYFKSPTEIVVGTDALNFSVLQPDKVVREFKRHMGEPNYSAQVDGRSYRPEELSAMVLRRLLDQARQTLGPIEKAVVTVPQVFQESRRRATQDAGRIAGLKDVDIVEEPVAAALAYGNTLLKAGGFFKLEDVFLDERVLVYDLGGGTFDATVMLLHAEKQGEFKTLATIGDERLGGKDFDEVLENLLIDRFAQQSGYDPRQAGNKELMQEFRLKAIDAKVSLSEVKRVTVNVTHEGKEYTIPLPIGDFERAAMPLLTRTEHTLVEMLEKNGLSWSDVDRILLVGGSSRMPMVGKMLQRISNRRLDLSLPPDTAVAKGAALFAASKSLGSKIQVKTVNSHALGLMAHSRKDQGSVNSVILPANQPTHTRVEKSFDVNPGMRTISLPILLGEARDPNMCSVLGKLRVFDMPPALPAGSKARVGFLFQENGLLKVDVAIHPGGANQPPTQANFEVVVEGIMKEDDVREATHTLRGIEIE